jgi:hypothetical protein
METREVELLRLTINQIRAAQRLPEYLFDKVSWEASLEGCKTHSEASLIPLRFGGHYPTYGFRARSFIPEDFGLDLFTIKLGKTGPTTWIPLHYHENATRVVLGFIEHRPPIIRIIRAIHGDRRHGPDPVRWIYDQTTQAWYAKLVEPHIIEIKEQYELKVEPLKDFRERVEIGAEEIADSLSGEGWAKCEIEPLGIIFAGHDYLETDELKKQVHPF